MNQQPHPQFRYGPLTGTRHGLVSISLATFRAEADDTTPSSEMSTPADRRLLSEISERLAPEAPLYDLYGLWHWAGGLPASIGDLRLVQSWAQSLGSLAVAVGLDWPRFSHELSEVWSELADAMIGNSTPDLAAQHLAAALTTLGSAVGEYIGVSSKTGDISDPNDLLPLFRWIEALVKALQGGPDDAGRYLTEEMVWGNLLGGAALAL